MNAIIHREFSYIEKILFYFFLFEFVRKRKSLYIFEILIVEGYVFVVWHLYIMRGREAMVYLFVYCLLHDLA